MDGQSAVSFGMGGTSFDGQALRACQGVMKLVLKVNDGVR